MYYKSFATDIFVGHKQGVQMGILENDFRMNYLISILCSLFENGTIDEEIFLKAKSNVLNTYQKNNAS